jgi:hypothetical protein
METDSFKLYYLGSLALWLLTVFGHLKYQQEIQCRKKEKLSCCSAPSTWLQFWMWLHSSMPTVSVRKPLFHDFNTHLVTIP